MFMQESRLYRTCDSQSDVKETVRKRNIPVIGSTICLPGGGEGGHASNLSKDDNFVDRVDIGGDVAICVLVFK